MCLVLVCLCSDFSCFFATCSIDQSLVFIVVRIKLLWNKAFEFHPLIHYSLFPLFFSLIFFPLILDLAYHSFSHNEFLLNNFKRAMILRDNSTTTYCCSQEWNENEKAKKRICLNHADVQVMVPIVIFSLVFTNILFCLFDCVKN